MPPNLPAGREKLIMERKIDKLSIIGGAIGAFLMICSVVATQIADDKIVKWDFDLIKYQNEANNLLISKNESSRKGDYFGMMTGFDYPLSLVEESLPYVKKDPKIMTITTDFSNGKLNKFEYLNQMQNISFNEGHMLLEEYNKTAKEIEEHYEKNQHFGLKQKRYW